jgi:hypothetical protein
MDIERKQYLDKERVRAFERLTRKRNRNKLRKDEYGDQVVWESSFDLQRLNESTIDLQEVVPFVECGEDGGDGAEEVLQTTRLFACAFRAQFMLDQHINHQDIVRSRDIQAGESIVDFYERIARLRYSVPVGTVMPFVNVRSQRFDSDLGERRIDGSYEVEIHWWLNELNSVRFEGLDKPVDVTKLEPMREPEIPEWRQSGQFSSWKEWDEFMKSEARRARDAKAITEFFVEQERAKKAAAAAAEDAKNKQPIALFSAKVSDF